MFYYMSTPRNSFWTQPHYKNSPLGPQKVKNSHNIKSKSNSRFEGNIENESCSITWVDPKTVLKPYSNPQTSPLGPQKDNNNPRSKSNSNVRIEGIIENESCSTTWVDPKTVVEPTPTPKPAHLGPKKTKTTLKLGHI